MVTIATMGACYTSHPLGTIAPTIGNDIVATLTDVGSAQMASVVGPRVTGLSGRYLGLVGDTLLFSVKTVIKEDGNEEFWKGEQVGVPRSIISSLSQREFSAVKSGTIVAAIIAAVVGITGLVYSGHTGSSGKAPPPAQ